MLVLPEPYHKWRFYKITQSDGRVRQIRDQIRDLSDLEALINKVGNSDVYHSIAYYCNPSRVSYNDFRGKKAGYQQADNLLINGDIVFDIDARNRSLSSARTIRQVATITLVIDPGRVTAVRLRDLHRGPEIKQRSAARATHSFHAKPILSTIIANGANFLQSYGLGSPAKARSLSLFRNVATSRGCGLGGTAAGRL